MQPSIPTEKPFDEISSALRLGNSLSAPLYYVCSPSHKGHADLTSSPLPPAKNAESLLRIFNLGQGLRSLPHRREHLTTRADDSHATPVPMSLQINERNSLFLRTSSECQDWVRFFVSFRIKPHNPLVVRLPVNSFEF